MQHVDLALREEHGRAGLHGRHLAVDQRASAATDDVNHFLAVRMRMSGSHPFARGDSDDTRRTMVGGDAVGRHDPAQLPAWQVQFLRVRFVNSRDGHWVLSRRVRIA